MTVLWVIAAVVFAFCAGGMSYGFAHSQGHDNGELLWAWITYGTMSAVCTCIAVFRLLAKVEGL